MVFATRLADLRPSSPKLEEFLQIARTLHHLTGDRTVDCDVLSRDVLQNAIVCCRRSPEIVLWLQPVD